METPHRSFVRALAMLCKYRDLRIAHTRRESAASVHSSGGESAGSASASVQGARSAGSVATAGVSAKHGDARGLFGFSVAAGQLQNFLQSSGSFVKLHDTLDLRDVTVAKASAAAPAPDGMEVEVGAPAEAEVEALGGGDSHVEGNGEDDEEEEALGEVDGEATAALAATVSDYLKKTEHSMRVPALRAHCVACGLAVDGKQKSLLLKQLRTHIASGGSVLPARKPGVARGSSASSSKRKRKRVGGVKQAALAQSRAGEGRAAKKGRRPQPQNKGDDAGYLAAKSAAAAAAASIVNDLRFDALLSDDASLSTAMRNTLAEVHYNFGRLFHHLSVTHLAIESYRRVLALHDSAEERGNGEDEDGERVEMVGLREAAHNLVQIYRASGSKNLARQVIQRYLVV